MGTSTAMLDEQALRLFPDLFAEHASKGRWVAYPHLRFMAEQIAYAIARPRGRLIINIPPRHGKSELTSHWTPVWLMECDPTQRVILCSYSDVFAADWGRKVKGTVAEVGGERSQLTPDSKASSRFNNRAGGGMVTAGIGGGITGYGFDLGLIDEIAKSWQQAYSPTFRRLQVEWFNSTFYSRAEPDASIIVVTTRWHPQDLCGYLLGEHQDDWQHIRLPAIAEANDPLGREPGDPLCPERYTIEDLRAIERAMGTVMFGAIYQQNPEAAAPGTVYRHFGVANLDPSLELIRGHPLDVSFDFNINPGMHLLIGQAFPLEDRYTAVHEIHAPRMDLVRSLEAFARLFDEIGGQAAHPEIRVFGDPAGNARNISDGRTMYDLIRNRLDRLGVRLRVMVPAKHAPVIDGVNTLNDALSDVDGVPHYFVHPRCERLVRDFRELMQDDEGGIDKGKADLSHAAEAERNRIHYLRPIRGGLSSMPTGRFGFGAAARAW